MRLALQTVICCCVFTSVLLLAEGATGELNTSLKKRFRVWMQSRMKRDLCNNLVTDNERHSDIHAGPQKDGNAKFLPPPSSFGIHQISAKIRPRRSASSVCFLFTCAYHNLVDRLTKTDPSNKTNAPMNKIGSGGYGRRRRRSLQEVTQLALQIGRQRRSTEAASKVSLAAEMEDNS